VDIDQLRPIFPQADLETQSIGIDYIEEVGTLALFQRHIRLLLFVRQDPSSFDLVASLDIIKGHDNFRLLKMQKI